MKISQLNEELLQEISVGRKFFNTLYQNHGIKLMMASENLERLASLIDQNNNEKKKILEVRHFINRILFASFKLNECLGENVLTLKNSLNYLRIKKQEISEIDLDTHQNFKSWNKTDFKVIDLIYKKKNFWESFVDRYFINKVTVLKRKYNHIVEAHLYEEFIVFLKNITIFNNTVIKCENKIVESINSIVNSIKEIKKKVLLLNSAIKKIKTIDEIDFEFLVENVNYFLKQEETKFLLDTYNKNHRYMFDEFKKVDLDHIHLYENDKEIQVFLYINKLPNLLIKINHNEFICENKEVGVIRIRENMFNFLNGCEYKEYFYSSVESKDNMIKIMSEVFANFCEDYTEEDDRVVKEILSKCMTEYFMP